MKCLLHIGAPKTGTSSLQLFLLNHPEALRDAGYYYPLVGRDLPDREWDRHRWLLRAAQGRLPKWRSTVLSIQQIKTHVAWLRYPSRFDARLQAEIGSLPEGTTCILTDEDILPRLTEDGAGRLYQMLSRHFSDIEVVCTIRAPGAYLPSAYAQSVRLGNRSRFESFARVLSERTLYLRGLDRMAAHVGEHNVTLFNYRPDMVGMFCDHFGIVVPKADEPVRNPSATHLGIEVLRRLNAIVDPSWQRDARRLCERSFKGRKWVPDPVEIRGAVLACGDEMAALIAQYRFAGGTAPDFESLMSVPTDLPPQTFDPVLADQIAQSIAVASGHKTKTAPKYGDHPWYIRD